MRNWSLKYFFSLWYKLRQKNFFNSCFVKVPILSFPIHLAAIKWFLFLFFPSWKLYFFFAGFFFRMCYCSVFGYFQIAFNNLTSNKQMKIGGKNNSCVTAEWKVFHLSCDTKRLQTLHFSLQNIQKLSEEEEKTAHKVWLDSVGHVL